MADRSEVVRVVIADDEEDIRVLLRVNLQLDGRFDVVGEAETGGEAIDLVAAERPDVLVLDLRMPEMSGEEALPVLREAWPDLPVVVFSAHVTDELAEDLHAAGATCVLSKSLRPADVVRHLVAAAPAGHVDAP